MLNKLLSGAALAAALSAPGLAGAADFQLRILHVNDVHARYDEVTATGTSCTQKDRDANKCVAGAARLATKLKELRGSAPNSLFLDAGDQFQGTLFYTKFKDEAPRTFLSMLGADAQAVGNHEFDDGPKGLASYLAGVKWPVLSANTDVSGEPLLAGKIPGSAVLTVGGEKVGIIGLTTPETPVSSSPGATVKFGSEVEAAKAEVAKLQQQGVNKIIALTHLGLSVDRALAAQVDGIDVIVGGHSHSLLQTGNDKAAGSYPLLAKSPSGRDVPIVTAMAYGIYLGKLDVTFDAAGNVTAASGEPVMLENAVAKDPAVEAQIQRFNEPLMALKAEKVGKSAVELVGASDQCRFQECVMGNLIADAMLDAAKSQGAQVAIMNGGGIRSSIPAGDITMGQVIEVLPFSNTLAWGDVKGEALAKAIEGGVARAHDKNASGTGRFPQVAGLKYSFDASKPEGQRVQSVEIRQADGSFKPIDPAATYKVVTNNFVRSGGDGYPFADAKNAYDFGPNLEDVVAAYIKAKGEVAPKVDGRIVRAN